MTTLQDKVPTGLDRKEAEVYRHLDPARLPRHIAVIMDGNGRWAKRRHMPRVAGHRAGVALHGGDGRTDSHSCPDALRVLRRKLEKAAPKRSQFLNEPAQPVSEGRSSYVEQE